MGALAIPNHYIIENLVLFIRVLPVRHVEMRVNKWLEFATISVVPANVTMCIHTGRKRHGKHMELLSPLNFQILHKLFRHRFTLIEVDII